jgi:hypothetical protein
MTTGPKGQKRPADVTPEPPDGEARRRSPEAASKCRNKGGIEPSDVRHRPHLPNVSILVEPDKSSGSIVTIHIMGDVFIP